MKWQQRVCSSLSVILNHMSDAISFQYETSLLVSNEYKTSMMVLFVGPNNISQINDPVKYQGSHLTTHVPSLGGARRAKLSLQYPSKIRSLPKHPLRVWEPHRGAGVNILLGEWPIPTQLLV